MMRCGDEIKLTVTKPNPMKLAPLPLMARQSIHVWFPTMYHTYFDICTGYTIHVTFSHFIFAAPWPRNQFTSEHMLHLHLISYHGDHCIFAVSPTHCKHNNISKRMQIKPCVSISVMLLILYLDAAKVLLRHGKQMDRAQIQWKNASPAMSATSISWNSIMENVLISNFCISTCSSPYNLNLVKGKYFSQTQ